MSKKLRKAIMRRSYLEKKYFKRIIILLEFTKSRKNICIRLYKRERKKFFNGLNSFFVLVEEQEVWQNESEITKKLTEFFNAVFTLGITENSFMINEEYENISDPVQRGIVKF